MSEYLNQNASLTPNFKYLGTEFTRLSESEYASLVWQRIRHFKELYHMTWRLIALRMDVSVPNLYKTMAHPYTPRPQKILALTRLFNCSMDDLLNVYKPLPPSVKSSVKAR